MMEIEKTEKERIKKKGIYL